MHLPRIPLYLGCLWALLLLSSCAFGDRHVFLTYDNSIDSYVNPYGDQIIDTENKPIYLVPFEDDRQKVEVGHVENAYGMETAQVYADNDVAEWVTDAVRSELTKAGYHVTMGTSDEAAPPDTIHVTGRVVRVYAKAYMTYEGNVTIEGQVYWNGQSVFQKGYQGNTNGTLNVAMTSKKYRETLVSSLRKATQTFVREINELKVA